MKVVFLCGGIGKRMQPIQKDKPLLNFLGKPLLEHQIRNALEANLKEFVIVANPFNYKKIKELCEKLNIDVEIAIQKNPQGMADALLSAKELLNEEILVINPNDIFEPFIYKKIIREGKKSDYPSLIVGYGVTSYFPGGYLVVNEENELMEIVEKPGEGNEPSNLVNLVIHLHKDPKKLLNYLEKVKSRKDDVYEKSISKMIKDGIKVKVVDYDGEWHAIKYPWHILNVLEYFFKRAEKKISEKAEISEKATIEGKVIIEDGVKVLENATIRGPCYIGRNTLVGNNTIVRNGSHIGESCIIGYSTEIKHSYIGDGCWFHSSYIGDSIISDNCLFGAGSVTANLRFDEGTIKVKYEEKEVDTKLKKFGAIVGENSKVGVNASIMPGIRVGPNAIVGPGVILYENLGPNEKIFLKQTLRK